MLSHSLGEFKTQFLTTFSSEISEVEKPARSSQRRFYNYMGKAQERSNTRAPNEEIRTLTNETYRLAHLNELSAGRNTSKYLTVTCKDRRGRITSAV